MTYDQGMRSKRNPRSLMPKHKSRHSIQGYQILISGYLDDSTFEWFEGLKISLQPGGNTLFSGSILDQAALMRILLNIHELGLTILSVKACKRNKHSHHAALRT
jgi:hypothetical protein